MGRILDKYEFVSYNIFTKLFLGLQMKKYLVVLCSCLLFVFALFPTIACGKKGGDSNENLWHGYKIYNGSTLDLEESGIDYTLEFFPENGTYLCSVTQLGETSEITGTYSEGEDGVIYMYSTPDTLKGIFTIDGNSAILSSTTSVYMEYFTRD